MNVLLVYFSGTGNTRKIAELYRAAFAAKGASVTLASLPEAEADPPDPAEFDLVGFGYPIHAFNAPANVLAFVKKLPPLPVPKRVFLFKSSGEPVRMNDVSSLKLAKLLRKRNYIPTNEYRYVMPYNIIFRHTDEAAYRMWDTAQKLVPVDCDEILSGMPRLPRKLLFGDLLAWILRIEHPGAHLIGKGFKATDRCVNCGLCVRTCPANNIAEKDGKPKFGNRCLICMRCVFTCPQDAIKPGILKSWKVNGAYSFAPPDPAAPPEKDKHADYCKKAYDRYYRDAEEKIGKNAP